MENYTSVIKLTYIVNKQEEFWLNVGPKISRIDIVKQNEQHNYLRKYVYHEQKST